MCVDYTLFDDTTGMITIMITSLDSSESLPSESISPLSAMSPRVIPLSYPTREQGRRSRGEGGGG